MIDLTAIEAPKGPPPFRCVIRLRTTAWSDRRGVHLRRSLMFMRRLSSGFNPLEEDAHCAGALEAIESFVNLHRCNDGLYEIVVTDLHRDYETGLVEDWRLMLVPLSPPPPAA